MDRQTLKKLGIVIEKINYLYKTIKQNGETTSPTIELALLKQYATDLYNQVLEIELDNKQFTTGSTARLIENLDQTSGAIVATTGIVSVVAAGATTPEPEAEVETVLPESIESVEETVESVINTVEETVETVTVETTESAEETLNIVEEESSVESIVDEIFAQQDALGDVETTKTQVISGEQLVIAQETEDLGVERIVPPVSLEVIEPVFDTIEVEVPAEIVEKIEDITPVVEEKIAEVEEFIPAAPRGFVEEVVESSGTAIITPAHEEIEELVESSGTAIITPAHEEIEELVESSGTAIITPAIDDRNMTFDYDHLQIETPPPPVEDDMATVAMNQDDLRAFDFNANELIEEVSSDTEEIVENVVDGGDATTVLDWSNTTEPALVSDEAAEALKDAINEEDVIDSSIFTDSVDSSSTSVLNDLVAEQSDLLSNSSTGRIDQATIRDIVDGIEEEEIVPKEPVGLELNEFLAQQSTEQKTTEPSVADRLSASAGGGGTFPITFNQRFAFINELFGSDGEAYDEAIRELSSSRGYIEALTYINLNLRHDYKWKDNDPVVREFLDIVKRRFLG